LERLQRTRKKLFEHPTPGATELAAERAAVATTWIATEDALSAGARALLRLVSFFAPEEVPRALIEKAGGVLLAGVKLLGEEPEREGGESDEGGECNEGEACERNLVELEKYSLITLRPETFACHRLVMAVQQLRVAPEERAPWLRLALEVFESSRPGSPNDVRNWQAWDALRPHLARVAVAADEADIAKPTSRWMSDLGLLYLKKALWAEAEPLMRRALAISEKSYGPEHPDVAIRVNNLASLLHVTNRLSEAEPLRRRALAIDEKSYGPEHPSVAIRLGNLAMLLKATNRLSEAEPLTIRALAIDEKSYGPEHPSVAIRLSNLAMLLKATNRLSEAEPLLRRSLAIDEKSYGPEHPEVAIDLNDLASLLKATNRLSEAEPLLRRALAILEKSYGLDHPRSQTVRKSLELLIAAGVDDPTAPEVGSLQKPPGSG
jgi:tetratricopeptide (TPR) repeat protein